MQLMCSHHLFKRAIKTNAQIEPNLNTRLSQFLLEYRAPSHVTTNVSPEELFLQCKLRTRFDLLKPNLESVVTTKQSNQKNHHDKHMKTRHFSKDELVMAKDFIAKKWIPGKIVNTTGPQSYSIRIENGNIVRRHADHIKSHFVTTLSQC